MCRKLLFLIDCFVLILSLHKFLGYIFHDTWKVKDNDIVLYPKENLIVYCIVCTNECWSMHDKKRKLEILLIQAILYTSKDIS